MSAESKPTKSRWGSDRYWWEYEQWKPRGGYAWYARVGQGGLEFQVGLFAWTERGIRRKIARFIRKRRREDYFRRTTTRRSS